MFDILLCIRDDHDLRLVILAAAVCLLSTSTAVLMLRQSRHAAGVAAQAWIVCGGFATGFGIWATHFIAMLGYAPGFIVGYKTGLTLASLAIVVPAIMLAFLLAAKRCRKLCIAVASVLAGGGFSAMHYVGMAALEMPATISWNAGYVVLSLVCAIVPFYPALWLAVRHTSWRSAVAAATIMAGAVIGLHFSGMTAIELVPARMDTERALLSPRTMSIIITIVALGLTGLCVAGWIFARSSRAAIAVAERQFRLLVKGISDCAIYLLDTDGRVASWNAGAERLKGYSQERAMGRHLEGFYTPEDRAARLPQAALATALRDGKFTGEGWRLRNDGSRFWAHVTIERIHDQGGHDQGGKHIGFAKITRDMTRFKQDQDRLENARRHLNAALEHMHQGLCLFDADERLILRNRRFAELWDLPDDSCPPGSSVVEVASVALSSRTRGMVSNERLDNMRILLKQTLADPDHPPVISEFGDDFSVSISSRPLPEGGWVTTFEDITERRRSEAKIAHMALHDSLTGLPNRISFNRWLDKEMDLAALRSEQVAVVAIDLDRFKEINDTQGHAAGDEMLQRIARALSEMAQDGEIVARLGGDEFAAAKLLAHPGDLADFVARVDACFRNDGTEDGMVLVGASLGIAVYPMDSATREGLLNNADLAMYRAKGNLAEHICYYESGMDETARNRRQLANDLRQAIARGELALLYQPQRSLRDEEISGYEALLRWHHPRLGSVPPDQFIPIAEETGDIIRIGEWVLQTACTEAAKWGGQPKIAVNVSSVQLLQADLPEVVTRILLETGISPRQLELEITETAIISDKVRALNTLRRIKALGVTVAMDDFGTGYSSLDTLHSFPFDKIKIDKSFMLQADHSEQARAIIRAVLALGRSLSIPVLAEGVETETQLQLLKNEGCEEAQGYYFGRPAMAPSEITLDGEAGPPLAAIA